ncbi:DUF305 domain-containing protein, partial [Candidatus Peregrinibacteria bacterium]|nr:DUF305 domain-containing protein [Candidatus Peregrinibacteria bacterium]
DLRKMEALMRPSHFSLMNQSSSSNQDQTNDPMREHCKMMPNMMGCDVYRGGQDARMMDPMDMSMMQMGQMLAGKTGDDLDRAFIEGMIPHHQAAVDMARYLIGAKHPELQKMGQDIIAAQSKEIDQMKKWQVEWGYTQ